jgi:uncharacterized protein (DUF2147 family)
MKHTSRRIAALALLSCILLTVVPLSSSQVEHRILGRWFSRDIEEPENDGIIEIYQKGDRFYGKIVWSRRPEPIDVNGDNKSLMGRDILTGFKHDSGSKYSGGKIYNPRDGRTYSCNLEVLDEGKRLKIRGYVGISLFGRTEYWSRM